jgi:predicted metalloprotease with PDZ domain
MLLMADVRLRQMTPGNQSLDTALAALNDCCRATDRAWSARELFDKLDEETGTRIFSEIYDQHVASKNFPDLAQTYRALGVGVGANGIELSTDDGERRLRDAIMEAGARVGSEIPGGTER